MFRKQGKKEGSMGLSANTSTTLISKNTDVEGDIHFSGTLHIEGTLRGNIHIKDGGEGHLEIAENGRVEGQVTVPTVRVNGHVTGDIHSTKHVELAAKAVVEGNVHYRLIEMVKGSQVNGSLVYFEEEAKQKTKSPAPDRTPASDVEDVATAGSNTRAGAL